MNVQVNTNEKKIGSLNILLNQFPEGFTIENYKKAVNLLYKNPDKIIKREADQFLIEFQKVEAAWDISIEILKTPYLSEETYFNASQIIKKKIRYDFGNYTDNQLVIQNLATFLIEKIIDFKDHKLYLLTSFCQCYALLCVFGHMICPDIIKAVVSKLNNTDIKNLMSLLIIFNFLAEIVNDQDIVVDESARISFDLFLNNISNDVIVFLDYLIKIINDEQAKNTLIKNDPAMINFFRLLNKNVRN